MMATSFVKNPLLDLSLNICCHILWKEAIIELVEAENLKKFPIFKEFDLNKAVRIY